mmetsp:Transcript_60958/g.173377  ORF Transcript_60958/g.173377 Transcript_60958/m.173377 type:complete len:244 (-) Transcript_60958:83-814(-)
MWRSPSATVPMRANSLHAPADAFDLPRLPPPTPCFLGLELLPALAEPSVAAASCTLDPLEPLVRRLLARGTQQPLAAFPAAASSGSEPSKCAGAAGSGSAILGAGSSGLAPAAASGASWSTRLAGRGSSGLSSGEGAASRHASGSAARAGEQQAGDAPIAAESSLSAPSTTSVDHAQTGAASFAAPWVASAGPTGGCCSSSTVMHPMCGPSSCFSGCLAAAGLAAEKSPEWQPRKLRHAMPST